MKGLTLCENAKEKEQAHVIAHILVELLHCLCRVKGIDNRAPTIHRMTNVHKESLILCTTSISQNVRQERHLE